MVVLRLLLGPIPLRICVPWLAAATETSRTWQPPTAPTMSMHHLLPGLLTPDCPHPLPISSPWWEEFYSIKCIDLAYLYKALAFAHLYVPQSCYHKSSCLSTSGCMISTPAILTLPLLHFDPLSNCSSKPHYSQIPPKLIHLYDYPYLHWLGQGLTQGHLTRYSSKPQDYSWESSLLDDRLQRANSEFAIELNHLPSSTQPQF